MGRNGLQMSVAGLLGLVACVAVNVWLFRLGMIHGLIGLNVTKHVAVAVLCKALGINGKDKDKDKDKGKVPTPAPSIIPRPHSLGG